MDLGEQIGCVLSEMSFETFTPIYRAHINGKSPKFHNSLNTFGRDPPYTSVHECLGVNLMCTFTGDVV